MINQTPMMSHQSGFIFLSTSRIIDENSFARMVNTLLLDDLNEFRKHIDAIINYTDARRLVRFFKDHSKTSVAIFHGFRITPTSIANPVVRKRLIAEAQKSDALLELLLKEYVLSNQNLSDTINGISTNELKRMLPELTAEYGFLAVKAALLMDSRKSVRNLSKRVDGDLFPADKPSVLECEEQQISPPTETPVADEVEAVADIKTEFREKRRKYQEHIDKLESELKKISALSKGKDSEIRSMKERIADLERILSKNEKDIARAERELNTTKKQNAELRASLKHAQRQIEKLEQQEQINQESNKTSIQIKSPQWKPVIDRMIANKNYENAIAFCTTLCELEPDNCQPHAILMAIYDLIGDMEKKTDECVWLSRYFMGHRRYLTAFSYAIEAMEIQPDNCEIQSLFKSVLSHININDNEIGAKLSKRIAKTKAKNMAAHRRIKKLLKQMGPHYVKILINETELHGDKVLDLQNGKASMQLSVNDIIRAISLNDVDTVDFVRSAISIMKKTDTDLYGAILRLLDNTDQSIIQVLRGGNKPIIVDGSNVAWHGVSTNNAKPRLRNIYAIREGLRYFGYFPIFIYIDAALVHQIDHASDLQKMIDNGEVLPADGATSADTLIIEKSHAYGCPVVTNDRMREWDPDNLVEKVQFRIDQDGGVEFMFQ